MANLIFLVNSPSNTEKTLLGTSEKDDYIKLDRSPVTSTFSGQVWYGIYFDPDGAPVFAANDILYRTDTDLKLPPLNAANAIENIVVVGARTQTFDGIFKIAAQGDYSLSSDPYLMIGGN